MFTNHLWSSTVSFFKKQKVPSNCADMFLLTQRVHTPTKAHTDVYKVGMLSQD